MMHAKSWEGPFVSFAWYIRVGVRIFTQGQSI